MEKILLNLGCGTRKLAGYVNIDIRKEIMPDLVHDIEGDGLPYESNSVEKVRAWDFLEHVAIGRTIFVIEEIWRVLRPGGLFEHYTPSTEMRGAFQDPTHVSFWNINSWFYYTLDAYREQIGTVAKFKIIESKDVLTSDVERVLHTYGLLQKIGA